MKIKKIKIFLSIVLIIAMISSNIVISVSATSTSENMQDYIVDEEPFEFEYLPGDMPIANLSTAVLDPTEVPDVIGIDTATKRHHVNRLYEQEPDEYTIIFQNRDGGKTIYVFSEPVKSVNNSGTQVDMSKAQIAQVAIQRASNSSPLAIGTNRLTPSLAIANTETKRATTENKVNKYHSDLEIKDYQILEPEYEIKQISTSPNALSSLGVNNIGSVELVATVSTYSPLSGDYAIKGMYDNKYISYVVTTFSKTTPLYSPHSKWLFEYAGYDAFYLRSQSAQNLYIRCYEDDSVELSEWDEDEGTHNEFKWRITSSSDGVYNIISYISGTLYNDLKIGTISSYYGNTEASTWELTNNVTYIPLQSVSIDVKRIIADYGNDIAFPSITCIPENATYVGLDTFNWYSENTSILSSETECFGTVNTGVGSIYCKYIYGTLTSSSIPVYVTEDETLVSDRVYLIRPYTANITASTKLLTMNITSSGTNLSLSDWALSWNNNSQGFKITSLSETENRYRISAVLAKNQYTIPTTGTITGQYNPENRDAKPNSLTYSSNTLSTTAWNASNSTTQQWQIKKAGNVRLIINVANPNIALAHSGTSVVGADNNAVGQVEWCITQFGIDVPLIRQTASNYCGPTSAIQVLYGSGFYDYSNVNNNFVTQISTLASDCGMSPGGSAVGGGTLRDELKDLTLNSFRWLPKYRSNGGLYMTRDDMDTYYFLSANNGYAPIISIGAEGIKNLSPQYNNYPYTSGHYIVIMGYDVLTGKLVINDCNWNINYCGLHISDMNTLYANFGGMLSD